MIDDKMPLFVCRCCGNIIRAIAYEESDVYRCRICGAEMFKTEYFMNDSEYNEVFSDMHKCFELKGKIFNLHVMNSEQYSNEMHKKRLSEEQKSFNQWMYGFSEILP